MSFQVLYPAQGFSFVKVHGWVHGHGILRAGRLAFYSIMFDALMHRHLWGCLDWLCEVSFLRQQSAVHILDPGTTQLDSFITTTPQISRKKLRKILGHDARL